jgi:hypothetical protein
VLQLGRDAESTLLIERRLRYRVSKEQYLVVGWLQRLAIFFFRRVMRTWCPSLTIAIAVWAIPCTKSIGRRSVPGLRAGMTEIERVF